METENRFARMFGINLLPTSKCGLLSNTSLSILHFKFHKRNKNTHPVTRVQSNLLYSTSILLSLIAYMYICRDSCDHLVSNAFSIQHSHFSCFHLPYHLVLTLHLKDLQEPCWKYYNWDTITHRPIVLLNWHSDSSKKNFIYKFFCINFKKIMQKWFCRTRCCNNTKSQQLVKTMNIWNSNTFCVLMLKSISPAHMICGQGQVIFSYPLIIFSIVSVNVCTTAQLYFFMQLDHGLSMDHIDTCWFNSK